MTRARYHSANMTTRTNELDALMRQHALTARQVGEILNRKPHTVRVWRSRYAERTIPDHTLQVLKMKLAERGRGVR